MAHPVLLAEKHNLYLFMPFFFLRKHVNPNSKNKNPKILIVHYFFHMEETSVYVSTYLRTYTDTVIGYILSKYKV